MKHLIAIVILFTASAAFAQTRAVSAWVKDGKPKDQSTRLIEDLRDFRSQGSADLDRAAPLRQAFLVLLGVCAPVVVAQSSEPGTRPASAPAVQPPKDATLELFLLIGQSNMAGRGKVEPQDQVPHPRVWMLDKDDRWTPATDPLHFDKPKIAGVGLGSQFGRTIADVNPSIHVGLIPSAVGGTTIEQWRKGGELYENAVRRARIAMKGGGLTGILWHQGESDTAAAKQAVYAEKLGQLIADLRTDLNAPDAPFVLGQLGPFRDATVAGNDTMNELLRRFPRATPTQRA